MFRKIDHLKYTVHFIHISEVRAAMLQDFRDSLREQAEVVNMLTHCWNLKSLTLGPSLKDIATGGFGQSFGMAERGRILRLG